MSTEDDNAECPAVDRRLHARPPSGADDMVSTDLTLASGVAIDLEIPLRAFLRPGSARSPPEGGESVPQAKPAV
jgi:hypothetical protein